MEKVTEDQTKYQFTLADAMGILSFIVSIVSLVFAYKAYDNSNTQFTIINQSYLKIDPMLMWTAKEVKTNSRAAIIPDAQLLSGVNISVNIENIGNTPARYKVLKFDFFIDGQKRDEMKPDDDREGLLLPKQVFNFTLHGTLYFKDFMTQIPFSEARARDYQCHVVIEYQESKTSKKKYVDRRAKWSVIANNEMRTDFLTFDDRY